MQPALCPTSPLTGWRKGATVLQAVLLICNIASHECSLATASSHYTIVCENQTPMGCVNEGYEQFARMSGLYDSKTQYPIVSAERR